MVRSAARDLLVVVSSLALLFDSGALRAEDTLVFERDIRPILRERCFDCHGAQEEKKASPVAEDVPSLIVRRANCACLRSVMS